MTSSAVACPPAAAADQHSGLDRGTEALEVTQTTGSDAGQLCTLLAKPFYLMDPGLVSELSIPSTTEVHMRLAFFLALVLSVAPAANAQTPIAATEPPAPLANDPVPQVIASERPTTAEVNVVQVRLTTEPDQGAPALQDQPSRSLWFVVGALVAVVVVLAFTL